MLTLAFWLLVAINAVIAATLYMVGIRYIVASTYHPQTDGKREVLPHGERGHGSFCLLDNREWGVIDWH